MKKWEKFEIAVHDFVKAFAPYAEVKHNIMLPDKDTGTPRQRDVWVEAEIAGLFPIKIHISCKRYKRKINQQDVDAFIGELRSSGAHAGVIYTYKGFSKNAIDKAKVNNISLCKLPEVITIVYYCCYSSFRVGYNNEMLDYWGNYTFEEIFDITNKSGKKVIDILNENYMVEEIRVSKQSIETRTFPKQWSISIAIQYEEDIIPDLILTIEGMYRVYKSKLEAHILNGSYSFTDNKFQGTQKSPWICITDSEPGEGWVLIEYPPDRIEPGMGLFIPQRGNLKESILQKYKNTKLKNLH